MLKIRLYQLERHRNETTFRPYIAVRKLFREIGVEFVVEGNDYDMVWAAQASYIDRAASYEKSLKFAKWNLNQCATGCDLILFDGQDSASLMASYDAFQKSPAKLLLKNSLYKNRDWYKEPSVMGRTYWDSGSEIDYKINEDIDWSKIQLTGANWLSTVQPHWYDWTKFKKDIDVCALFAYPGKDNYEFNTLTNPFYDRHRKKCIDQLKKLPSSIKVAMLEDGKRIPIEEYWQIMMRSKIIIAPFGYGEIAPRDIESAMVGSVLIKPTMDHLETIPDIYVPDPHNEATFVSCDWEYNNIQEKIEGVLGQFKTKQEHLVNNMKQAFVKEYDPMKLVYRTYEWLNNLEGYETE